MIDAIDKVLRISVCPACYEDLKRTNVVREDAVLCGGVCGNCRKESKVIIKCRYTMKGREMERRGYYNT